MSRAHADHMRAFAARWWASTPDERRAELDRLDAGGYAEARERVKGAHFGDFGAASAGAPDDGERVEGLFGEVL